MLHTSRRTNDRPSTGAGCLVAVVAGVAIVALMVAGFIGRGPLAGRLFFPGGEGQAFTATAGGPPPWEVEGDGVTFAVLGAARPFTGDTPFDDDRRIAVTVEYSGPGDDLRKPEIGMSDDGVSLRLDLANSEPTEGTRGGERGRVTVVFVALGDELPSTVTVSLTDFFWDDSRSLAVADVPVQK